MQALFSYFSPSPLSCDIDSLPSEDCLACMAVNIQTFVRNEGSVFGHTTADGVHHVMCEPCKTMWMEHNNDTLSCPICREDITWSQIEYKKSPSDDSKFTATSAVSFGPSSYTNILLKISSIAIIAIASLVFGATLMGLVFSISKVPSSQVIFEAALACQALFISRLGIQICNSSYQLSLPSAFSIATAATLYALPLIKVLPLIAMNLARSSQGTPFQARRL
jgi:hypothetical protein